LLSLVVELEVVTPAATDFIEAVAVVEVIVLLVMYQF